MKYYKHEFTAHNGAKSACNVYTLRHGKVKYIGFEDINKGMSVTNATEILATGLIHVNKWDPNNVLFFEWYADQEEGTVDEITYTWKNGEATDPRWKVFCDRTDNPFKN